MRSEPSDFKSQHEEAKGGKRWRMKASPKVRPALPRPSVYSTNLTPPPPPKPPYPHWIVQSTRSKTFFIVDFTQLFYLVYRDRLLK